MVKSKVFLSLITGVLCCSAGLFGQESALTCTEPIVINSVVLTYGYAFSDIDTVHICLYKRNGGFRQATDSFTVVSQDIVTDSINKGRYVDIGSVRPIKSDEDWSIRLKNGRVVYISDVKTGIVTERHQFKRCRMISYIQDGKPKTATSIEVIKPGFRKRKTPPQPIDKRRSRLIL